MPRNPDIVTTDGLEVTRDEGVELMVHHLMLAALFFETTPDDKGDQIYEEIARRMTGQSSRNASVIFTRTITETYEAMKDGPKAKRARKAKPRPQAVVLYESEFTDFGIVRLEAEQDGLVLWVGGTIRWKSWKDLP